VADKTELEITIGPDGTVRIETHGLKGQACLAETKGLEEALGKVASREKTREFYLQDEKERTKARNR
jgi:hypothetical protein